MTENSPAAQKSFAAQDAATYYVHMRSGEVCQLGPCDLFRVTADEFQVWLRGELKDRVDRRTVYFCTRETASCSPGF
jgi:hypothetical protein